MSTYDIEMINDLIKNRRSIFPGMYSDEPVENTIIEQMIINANWAPTHRKTEPWRFNVFTGEGLKKFAEFQAERYKKTAGDKFKKGKYKKLLTKPLKASHIISIGMKRHKGSVPEIEEIMAVACAVQNMQLTASAYGVGCYWSTGGVTYDKKAKNYFKLDKKDKLLGFLYVGNIRTKWPKGKRAPAEKKVRWIKS